jgi:hypothetical protein
MRQMDEITERPARPLPAPSGPRSPTGPVPLIASAGEIPPPSDAALLVPYLPDVAPKVAAPATGQVDITAAAAALGIGLPSTSPSTSQVMPKRSRKRLIVPAIVVAVVALLGLIFRHSALVERFTGAGYDTNPLPTHSFPIPALTGAAFTYTFDSINLAQGVPSHLSQTDQEEVNFTAGIAKFSVNSDVSQIVNGTIGPPVAPSAPKEVFVDEQWTYQRGTAETDPWVRTPLQPASRAEAVLNHSDIRMYQDVFDPALRSQKPVSVVNETRYEVPVTTYTYTFAFGDFYESAPRLFDWVRSMEGNAADDATVTVAVSLDDQMLVRYLDVDLDYSAVIDKVQAGHDGTYHYRSTYELTSIAGATTVAIPTNVVDSTTTTLPAPEATTPVAVTP